jgi:hypothetical protein
VRKRVEIDRLPWFLSIDLLQEIAEVLRASTIVEERGKDATSKFWAAYKKVSSDYDDDMLERCNSNMDIVLIFVREISIFPFCNTIEHK